jgi:uncharacterized protein (TIGR00369 family)
VDAAQIQAFLTTEFPQALQLGAEIEAIEEESLTLALEATGTHLRPGGTVSGPTLMTLVDTAMYFLILSRLGPVQLAVTTHLSIDFLRRPPPGRVRAIAELLKLGRRLVVGRVTVIGAGTTEPIAHASITYALPPANQGARPNTPVPEPRVA